MLPSFSKGGMNRWKFLHFSCINGNCVLGETRHPTRLKRKLTILIKTWDVLLCTVPFDSWKPRFPPEKPTCFDSSAQTTPQKYAATVSGPKFCGLPDGDDDAVAATDGTSGLVAPDSGSSGLVAPDSGSSGLVAPDSGSSGLVAPDSGSSGLVAPVVLPATLAPLPALPDTVPCFEWDER